MYSGNKEAVEIPEIFQVLFWVTNIIRIIQTESYQVNKAKISNRKVSFIIFVFFCMRMI